MRTRRLLPAAIFLAAFPAFAEPRLPQLEAKWAADAARADYLVVWDIDRDTIGRGDPYRTFRTVYDGLMYALSEARRLIEPGTPAVLHLDPAMPVRGWDDAYAGRLVSRETYLEGDRLTVHAEITKRDCGRNRVQVFYVISLAPPSDPAWEELRKSRERITCDKSRN